MWYCGGGVGGLQDRTRQKIIIICTPKSMKRVSAKTEKIYFSEHTSTKTHSSPAPHPLPLSHPPTRSDSPFQSVLGFCWNKQLYYQYIVSFLLFHYCYYNYYCWNAYSKLQSYFSTKLWSNQVLSTCALSIFSLCFENSIACFLFFVFINHRYQQSNCCFSSKIVFQIYFKSQFS